MIKSEENIFFEQMIFMPPEFFKEKLQFKSLIFYMVAVFAFFIEKNYIYDITTSAFINSTPVQMQKFFELSHKQKNFYTKGLNPDIHLRKHKLSSNLKPDSGNLTSLEDIPDLYHLKSNKLILFQVLHKLSCFSREFAFFIQLIRYFKWRY
jgi:hypothetical protein